MKSSKTYDESDKDAEIPPTVAILVVVGTEKIFTATDEGLA